MTLRTLADLNPDEYNQGLLYYPLMVNLNKCKESCNTLDDLSNSLCVPKKKEDAKTLKYGVFDMIKQENETNGLTKHVSCKCKSAKCKLDDRKCNSNEMKSWCVRKSIYLEFWYLHLWRQ